MAKAKKSENVVVVNLTGLTVRSCENFEVADSGDTVEITTEDGVITMPMEGVIFGSNADGLFYASDATRNEEATFDQLIKTATGHFCESEAEEGERIFVGAKFTSRMLIEGSPEFIDATADDDNGDNGEDDSQPEVIEAPRRGRTAKPAKEEEAPRRAPRPRR